MQEVKGFTTINHNIRVKLRLSLHEYTLLYFLSEWRIIHKTNPSVEDYRVNLGINSADEAIGKILSGLVIKGLLDLDHVLTEVWNSEFRFITSQQLGDDSKNTSKSKGSRSKSALIKKQFIPPTLAEVQQFFKENDYQIEFAKKAFDYYKDGNWTDKSGTPVVNWRQKIRANWFKDEYKIISLQKNKSNNMGENLIELGNKYKK